ncbi:MAG TPA: aldo/keto reductase [Bacteroidota bacterium]|nr:aldo/keto reductase [Bacteroidota bacterium]
MAHEEIDRRKFLRNSLIGGAGALLSSSLIAQQKETGHTPEKETRPLITRPLGKTGILLPIVSFGVMRADSPALIKAAIAAGMVHFDTAHVYQNGKNEELLGAIFQQYKRDAYVISTKVPPTTGEPAAVKKTFLEKLDLSLKRLKMDHVDILYVHGSGSRAEALAPEMLEAVTAAKKAGKAKHVGVSTHRSEPEVIRAAIESGVYEVVLASVNFKQEHIAEVRKAIAEAAKAGIGIIAMKTMAGGFHDKERTKPINCSAALKYVLADENITTAIPGITNFDQLAMNAAVNRDVVLTAEEEKDLAALDNLRDGLYCQGCMQCVPDCPKALPIPDLMRAYMYAYGYNDNAQAHSLVTSLDLEDQPCAGCTACTVSCAKQFAVSERITDIMRIRRVPAEFMT